MEQYKKPVMKIVELEKVDILTCSQCDSPYDHISGLDALSNWEDKERFYDGCVNGCPRHKTYETP